MVSTVYLRRKDAAAYIYKKLGFGSPTTLAKLATCGGGPKMVYASRFPSYNTEALDEWIEGQMRSPVENTSQRSKIRKI